MASMSSLPEEDLTCPVCQDIFTDPVVLSCSHSFCKECVHNWWREKRTNECAVCKDVHPTDHPPRSLALRNLSEAFIQERRQRASKRQRTSSGSEDFCSLHAEELELFCQECEQPACVFCVHLEKHSGHSYRPVYAVALERKLEVEKTLKTLQRKLKVFNKVQVDGAITARHIAAQLRHTESQIKEQFKKLHQFLKDEEEASITALREEAEQKSQMMTGRERLEPLNITIKTLSQTIRAIREELRADNVSFLLNYKTTMEKAQLSLPDPQPASGPLIDVTKHLGNLTFRVWEKMKDIVSYNPVILDPNTAHPELLLSDDLTSVGQREDRPRLPDNPERFDLSPRVLGSEGFNSGTHSWDVEVGDNDGSWTLGVVAESHQRKGGAGLGAEEWNIRLHNHDYYTASTRPGHQSLGLFVRLLHLKQDPQRIRVQLDWDEGKLLFYDLDTHTHLHTITHRFTETLFPCVGTNHALKMLPGKVSCNSSLGLY